jgi:hypothetical protein
LALSLLFISSKNGYPKVMERTPEQRARDRVVDRLTLVRALIDQKHPLAKPKRIGVTPDGVATSAWDQHDSLINYLLLTCFDVLGQSVDFVQFGEWLTSRELEAERQEVLGQMKPELPPVAAARALHDGYNKRYGTTNGFMRFINEVISEEARNELLGSVHIGSIKPISPAKAAKLKKEFLYQQRNGFTHKAHANITVARMVDTNRMMIIDATSDEPIVKHAARMVEGRVDKAGAYFVTDWPYVLYRTVARAVNEPLPDFDPLYTLVFQFSDNKFTTLADAREADFKDKAKLADLVNRLRAVVMQPEPEVPEEWDLEAAVVRWRPDDES